MKTNLVFSLLNEFIRQQSTSERRISEADFLNLRMNIVSVGASTLRVVRWGPSPTFCNPFDDRITIVKLWAFSFNKLNRAEKNSWAMLAGSHDKKYFYQHFSINCFFFALFLAAHFYLIPACLLFYLLQHILSRLAILTREIFFRLHNSNFFFPN